MRKVYINIDITTQGYELYMTKRFHRWLFKRLFKVEVTQESAIGSCGRIILKEIGR